MVTLVVSGIADAVVLGLNFGVSTRTDAGRFFLAMMFINLLGKPVTFILSILALYSRRESFGISFGRNTQSGSAEAQPYQAPVTTYPHSEYKPDSAPSGYGYPPQTGQPTSYPPPPPAEYVPQ